MRIRRWFVPLLVFGALLLSGVQAKAQGAAVLVNAPGKVKKASRQKDEKGKNFRLRRRQKVTVVYERDTWYWVKTKKGQQAWVPKKNIRLLKTKTAKPIPAKPIPAVEPELTELKAKTDAGGQTTDQPKADVDKGTAAAQDNSGDAEPKPDDDALTKTNPIAPKPQPKPDVEKPVVLPKAHPVTLAQRLAVTKKPGRLDVMTSELDVRIRVDGKDVGKAPLRGLPVKGGVHTVSAEKAGFVTASAQIDVDGGSATAALAMVPTQETYDARMGGAALWNTLAYGGLGLGGVLTLAGLGASAWGQIDGSAVRSAIFDYNNSAVRTDQELADLTAQRDSAAMILTIGEVTLVSGLLVGAIGAVAAIVAPDTEHFAPYQNQE